MKRLLTLLLLGLAASAHGATAVKWNGVTIGSGGVEGIGKLDGSGTNTTLRNFVGVGSNYLTGTTYFGGGNAARFTNGFVTQDSVELGGDAIMLDPGFEFIGTHRGNGQFLTNIPSAAVAGGPFIGKEDSSGTNTTLHTPFLIAPTGTNATFRQDGVSGNAIHLPFNANTETIMRIGNFFIMGGVDYLDFIETGGPTSLMLLQGDSVIIQEMLTVQEQLIVSSGQDPLAILQTGADSTNYFQGDTRFDSNIWSWASTSANRTNSSLSDAIVAVDANGKEVEVVIGSGLSYTAATRTLLNTGGAGSGDTNGISYVDGATLIPAVQVRRDAGDNHVLDILWTSNIPALVFTNQDTASSIYFRYMNGFIPLKMTEGGDVSVDSELNLTLHAASVLAMQANLNTRTLNNTNGTTVLDFSGDAVVLDTVNVNTFNIQRFNLSTNLYGNTTSVNFANSRSTTNLAGNLVFDAGLLNFSATNYNELILHCYGDGANRTVTAPEGWSTTRTDHVVTNGQWSWILVSAQIGQFTNMAQIDFPNAP